jgi:NAD(P)-dependent dehydrogenase (short-subunit alcohol dehydrogenase family)
MTKQSHRVALVTGANKGIGREIVLQLAVDHGFHVFLGARNAKAGRTSADELQKQAGEKGKITFLKIDVSNPQSIQHAADEMSRTVDHLDALVNNAGICLDEDEDVLKITPEIFDTTFRTNTLGPLLVAQAFVPLLKKSKAPRIVNVSSGGGQLVDGADGWAPAYCISKTALNGVTSQLTAAFPKFAVNSACPGWVKTDMGGSNATRSVEEGAAGIVWLAADAPQKETGKFWRGKKIIPW